MSLEARYRLAWALTPGERSLLQRAAAGEDVDRERVEEVMEILRVHSLADAIAIGYELRALAA